MGAGGLWGKKMGCSAPASSASMAGKEACLGCGRRLIQLCPRRWATYHARDTAQGPPRRAGVVPLPGEAERRGKRRKPLRGMYRIQAALSQYPALKGLLMRSAMGDTSTSLSVGIFSEGSPLISMPSTAWVSLASFARSAWLVDAERATEKNRNTGRGSCDHPSSRLHHGRCRAAARALPCRTCPWQESAPAPQ